MSLEKNKIIIKEEMETVTINKRLFELMLQSSMGAIRSDSFTFIYDNILDEEYFKLLDECPYLDNEDDYTIPAEGHLIRIKKLK